MRDFCELKVKKKLPIYVDGAQKVTPPSGRFLNEIFCQQKSPIIKLW
jgi:hypothetical protein